MLKYDYVLVKPKQSSKYYESKGYIVEKEKSKCGNIIIKKDYYMKVKIKDVLITCTDNITLICDYCKKEFPRKFVNYIKYKDKFPTICKDACPKCKQLKNNESNLLIHGVENSFQREDIKHKIKETNLRLYGFDNPSQKTPYKTVCDYAISVNSELLMNEKEYNDNKGILKFRCVTCGITIFKSWNNFFNMNKKVCKECSYKNKKGKNNVNWNGGITLKEQQVRHSREYSDWRNSIFEKDKYTCQCCGDNKGGNLEAHHIENFSEREDLRFDVDNGITLCNECHNPNQKESFHNIYGTRNNTKEQLEEYIKNKLKIMIS